MDESIEIFNSSSILTLDEVLFYGLSPIFVFRHLDRYSYSDLTGYIVKKLFHTAKNRPRWSVIRARAKDGGILAKGYSKLRSEIWENLKNKEVVLLRIRVLGLCCLQNFLKRDRILILNLI
ncbi:PF07611 domain protein [Leptospira interrogans serovar Pyrogenes str. L0374]|uniref:PF07611 domain protein n=1 Tax=Leptospira interrogans serovar Pyrogenes str. L0374 TaxID=1049928 RepID=M6KGS8_LEPIR|nr:PF07611 domain protein [Leptospira interrogans serovar Pyrogenes str. L0374]